jgi:hypothetical protein
VKTEFKVVTFSKWFASDDPLAAKVARICILREDFLFEVSGLYAEAIASLDEVSARSRKAYFFRRSILTLNELGGAINRIQSDTQFKKLLTDQAQEVKAEFLRVSSQMQSGQIVTKRIRNAICAHVKESEVQNYLARVSPSAFGFFQMSQKLGDTHMKFVDELVAGILLGGGSEEEALKLEASKFETVFDLSLLLVPLIDLIFAIYARDRRLL